MEGGEVLKSGAPRRTWYKKHVQKDPFFVYYSYVPKSRSRQLLDGCLAGDGQLLAAGWRAGVKLKAGRLVVRRLRSPNDPILS